MTNDDRSVHASAANADSSTGEVVAQLTREISELTRAELRLAQAEISTKAKGLGVGAGVMGAAGLIALYAVGVLIATAILALALVVDAWLAALLVGVALLLLAGIAGLIGKRRVAASAPPIPTRTAENVKADIGVLKGGGQS